MGELWIVLAVSCGLAFLSEKYTLAWKGQSSRTLNNGIVLLLIVYLSIFAGLRTGYNDTFTYMSSYETMAAFPDILTGFSWKPGDNPGFILLNSLMKAAGFSAQSFVLFYSSLFVVSTVTFLKRYSSNFTLSIFLFVCAHGYLFSLAAMKQCTSIAIGLAAIPYALNHKWIRFAAIVLLAATYILLFLLIPILRFKPWSGGTWLLLALTVIAGLTLPNIVETIVNTAALLGDGYNAEEFIGEGVNVFRVLVASVPVLLTFLLKRRVSRSSAADNVFINLSFLYACIMFVGLFGTANYFGRLANYFSIFPAIVLPMILKKLSARDRRFLTVSMVACYLVYFYYGNAINENFAQEFSRITVWNYLGL